MLDLWFTPAPALPENACDPNTKMLGNQIQTYTAAELPIMEKTKIIIIGAGPHCQKVRAALHAFSTIDSGFDIVDMGAFTKVDASFIIQALTEIVEGARILPILLDAQDVVVRALATFLQQRSLKNHVCVHHSCNTRMRYTDLGSSMDYIAYQQHLSDPAIVTDLTNSSFNSIRLGALRSDFSEAEARIRSAHWMHFDLSAIRCSDSTYVSTAAVSGLTAEEACQLMRYAGTSNHLKVMSFESIESDASNDQLAHMHAQLVWYFLEGVSRSVSDEPSIKHIEKTHFIVNPDQVEGPLKFVKSNQTGRWWVEIAKGTRSDQQTYVPCTYSDYQKACKNVVSDRLIKAIELLHHD